MAGAPVLTVYLSQEPKCTIHRCNYVAVQAVVLLVLYYHQVYIVYVYSSMLCFVPIFWLQSAISTESPYLRPALAQKYQEYIMFAYKNTSCFTSTALVYLLGNFGAL